MEKLKEWWHTQDSSKQARIISTLIVTACMFVSLCAIIIGILFILDNTIQKIIACIIVGIVGIFEIVFPMWIAIET